MCEKIVELKNMEQQREKPKGKPSLLLYKPPVLRGDQPKQKRTSNAEKKVGESAAKIVETRPAEDLLPSNSQKQLQLKCEESLLLPNLAELVNESPQALSKIEQPSFEEVFVGLKKHMEKDCSKIGEFLASTIVPFPELTEQIAEFLVKHIIEDCGQKKQGSGRKGVLTNSFMALAGTPVAANFCQGIVRALGRYFECREELRGGGEEYFQVWLNFVALTYEFGQIAQEESIMQLIFDIFEYLLSEQILNSLKIAELESSLSILMIIGRRMEYPAQFGALKDLLRNAFLIASEAWTRKMLMLMVELGAAEWKMTADLEEYYFR